MATAASADPGMDWRFYTEKGAVASRQPISSTDAPAQPAYRFEVSKVTNDPWNVGFNHTVPGTIGANTNWHLHFWARSSTQAHVRFVLQQNKPPFPDSWRQDLVLTPDWKEYNFLVPGGPGYGEGEAIFATFLGFTPGTVDLAGMEVRR